MKKSNLNPQQAKEKLVEGNQRFRDGIFACHVTSANRRKQLESGQAPFAIIVTCSDSRTPPEILFDQGLGNLFVTRTAGNVVDPIAIGSIEYAAEHLGASLVLVLGHTKCGAVAAAVEGGEAPGSIGAIIEKIKPSVEEARVTGFQGEELIEMTTNLNIHAVVKEIKRSPIIKHLEEDGKLAVLGAKYFLGSGEVIFFE